MVLPQYRVAGASEYLAVTGFGIEDVKLAKKAAIWPGQACTVFDVSPVNYTLEVNAMSVEKLLFVLPAVFTIGPRTDDYSSLVKYAKLIAPRGKSSQHVSHLVHGVIEGETRVLAASMTMEEIFLGSKKFKSEVFEKIQVELNQFGLLIYNANVKQLVDVEGQEYFSYLGQKKQQEAANKAKIDVAEERMKGAIGAKEREGRTLQNAAKIDAETRVYTVQREGDGKKEMIKVRTGVTIFENVREAEVAQANSELAMKKAEWAQLAQLAQVESAKTVSIREAELQMEVERRNALKQTEKLKAEHLTEAVVDYETKVQEANWNLYEKQKQAEAALYEQEQEAEGRKVAAEAAFFVRKQEADAELYGQRKKAVGLVAMAEAEETYFKTLLWSLGGSHAALRDYLMINRGIYQDMARVNAGAVHGLQPKISLWTGAGEGGAMEEVAKVYKMLPPLLSTAQDQTGMMPPPWMGSTPA